MDALQFEARIRYWKPGQTSGLAVVDVPASVADALGGLRQQRVRGAIGSAEFVSNVMPAGGGRLALSVSKAMMTSAGLRVGDAAEITITGLGRE
jgi:hypothetical protein